MKVVTVSVAGGRRVGQIAANGTSTAAFDGARSEAQDGTLALICHRGAGMPPTRSPIPLIAIANTPVKCSVNGERRARSNASLLVFDGAKIIETVSAGVTLESRDAIAAGTPAGIGIDPPKDRNGGDVARRAIGGIGRLKNEIMERPA